MNNVKAPRFLRSSVNVTADLYQSPAPRTAAVAGLIAAASISTAAEAQQSPLPPVTVDAPTARPRPAARPNAAQVRARTALRAARRQQVAQQAPVPFPNAGGLSAPDANPYADPNAPYKADRVSSNKFTEPLLNTPRTVTVLTKELLADKNSTSLRDTVRTTAGVTLGTGEGGNAFGDRFFIRGFDVRNDIFVDGVRDPGVSVRENFFTEQVEILRGPASSFAGRGTTGGAINIVTKQATDRNFYNAETAFGTDATKRVTVDVNQVITPTFSVRANGLFQDANVAGRDFIKDDRWGGLLAAKWTPTDTVKVTANYIHTNLSGTPDFGVPYYRPGPTSPYRTAGAPVTEVGVPRNNFYGFVDRDFFKVQQDIATANLEVKFTPDITFSSKFRAQRSVLDYVGTLPEGPNITNANPRLWTVNANPQSRYQITEVLANQTDLTFKFDTGPVKHTTVVGVEVSSERLSLDGYAGLQSEQLIGTANGAVQGVNIFAPQFTFLSFPDPIRRGQPTKVPINTASTYVIETANYQDFIILNGGVRYDDYRVRSTNFAGQSIAASNGLVNYNGGIVIKPLPIASVYAAYATSSNPVGAEFDGTSTLYNGLNPALTTVNQIFGPERNRAYEVGTKWEIFDRRVLATAALFRTEKDNAREIVPGGIGGAGTIFAGAAYHIEGIDLSIGGKITDKWSIFGGVVVFQSRVDKSNIPLVAASPFTSNVGLRLANVAHESFNLLSKYQITEKFELGGQATYASKIYGGTLAANTGTEIPSHWRFDAFVEYKIDKNITAKLFVNNLTNERYYEALYQSATPFVFLAPGRSGTFVLSGKF